MKDIVRFAAPLLLVLSLAASAQDQSAEPAAAVPAAAPAPAKASPKIPGNPMHKKKTLIPKKSPKTATKKKTAAAPTPVSQPTVKH